MENNYSVLMSVYYKEKPQNLKEAILSIVNQSLPTNDFVIMCDGPLTPGLDSVLDEFCSLDNINIFRLEKNMGLGTSLNIGIQHCKNEFILRMDSDDISSPNRAEIEIGKLNEGFDVVGSWITEFTNDDPKYLIGMRKPPLAHKNIVKFAKRRNPFNHPSVAYRKTSVINAGNYQDFPYVEDYFLWIRMILNKCIVCNVEIPLVNMRSGEEMRARRGGRAYRKSQINLSKYMLKKKYINVFRYLLNIFLYCTYSVLPMKFKMSITKRFLRK